MKKNALLCVALDVDDMQEVNRLVNELKDVVDMFKVGLQLYCKYGNSIIDTIKKVDSRIFLDLKFLDIPNTVANACRVVTSLGVDIINIHSLGGADMMKAASDAVLSESQKLGITPPTLIGVTILTSISNDILNAELKIMGNTANQVVHLALLAKKAGLKGVVASPQETKRIREACGDDFLIVTPGIRPAQASVDDQKRVMTPRQAVSSGTDIMVIGRPICSANNPREAAIGILEEINGDI